jgi:Flp pilus assembly protein TadD
MEASQQAASKEHGLQLLKAGQVDEAIHVLKQLEEADPDDPQVHTYLGAAFSRKSDRLHAVWEFEEALRLEESAANYYNLGAMYESLHRMDEAVREYLTATQLDPSHARAAQAVARLHDQFQAEHQPPPEEPAQPTDNASQ